MKVIVVGGGPGGLYLSLLLKKKIPSWKVQVIERNPANATYGWGVLFSDRTLMSLREADYKTYTDITDSFVTWDAIDVWYGDGVIRCGGHVFAGIARTKILEILQKRCADLGVELHFEAEIKDPKRFLTDADLLVGADGVNSIVRETWADDFRPSLEIGKAKYIWLGTDKVFDAFTFIFRENEDGLFQIHAYPFDGSTGTFIVECDEATWKRAGLDQADEAQSLSYCEELFAHYLDGHRLMSNNSSWINFPTITNETWHHENIVILGDSAHTAHFSIGSGTKLAMEDVIALANPFERHADLESALCEYEAVRRPAVEAFQQAAQESRTYFENVRRNLKLSPIQFAFHLLTRSGRISYDHLRLRDPYFVNSVDCFFSESGTDSRNTVADRPKVPSKVAPPPMFIPFKLREVTLETRVVVSPTSTYSAVEGVPNQRSHPSIHGSVPGGVSLIVTEPIAVTAEGRITPGCAGMYELRRMEAWTRLLESIRSSDSVKISLNLSHAGRRGSTRPRWQGLDRPLLEGNWPLMSASALPYTSQGSTPKEMDRPDMEKVIGCFVEAARLGQQAGFDMLQLNFAHGYLLASFISPLTNKRNDDYGGSLEARMRFPMEVFDAVREEWPQEKPIAVSLSATDWTKGGLEPPDAVQIATMLKVHGCDLVTVLAGQTMIDQLPNYDPGFLTLYSEQIRNEACIPTMTGGHLTTSNQVNTVLAGGRADLCIMDPPP